MAIGVGEHLSIGDTKIVIKRTSKIDLKLFVGQIPK